MELSVYIFVLVGCVSGNTIAILEPGAVVHAVLRGYNKILLPVEEPGKAVNVSHSVSLIRLHSLEDQTLTLNVWIHMEWNDPGLKLFRENYEIRIPSRLIWLPDVVLYNSAEEIHGSFGSDLNVVVKDNGDVSYVVPTKLRSNCHFKGKKMKRHHKVTCQLKFGSWTYEGSHMDLYSLNGGVDLSNYFSNLLWKLVDTHVVRNEDIYECCPNKYVSLTYTLTFKYKGE